MNEFNNISIIPARISNIEHRSDIKITDNYGKYPIFVAPMNCLIDLDNYKTFEKAGLYTIIPRGISLKKRLDHISIGFSAFGLDELYDNFVNIQINNKNKFYVLLDIANGHMLKAIKLCKTLKEIYKDQIVLMAGNIANPETYLDYAMAEVDYIRVGIGSGVVCSTSETGVHYSMSKLLQEITKLKEINKNVFKSFPKIIADGGFKYFNEINKALVLGADYVMLGSIIGHANEAAGYKKGGQQMDYYGMSTMRAQEECGVKPKNIKVSEGVTKSFSPDYSIFDWIIEFKHYLRSMMSYTNCGSLEDLHTVETIEDMTYTFNTVDHEYCKFKRV